MFVNFEYLTCVSFFSLIAETVIEVLFIAGTLNYSVHHWLQLRLTINAGLFASLISEIFFVYFLKKPTGTYMLEMFQ